MKHQYFDRNGQIRDEKLVLDPMIRFIYSTIREKNGVLFRHLISRNATSILGYLNFDSPLASSAAARRDLERRGVDFSECVDDHFRTVRDIFERKIRYEEFRPMSEYRRDIVSPADAKVLLGSWEEHSVLFIKEKFFSFEELLGTDRTDLHQTFHGGDFSIFRLTPDKYHYNHTPVSGIIREIFSLDGVYHSCNPSAVIEAVTPFSKNSRCVTIIDTDVEGGSKVGLVAMIEVVALMIGEIVQCYSEKGYETPQEVTPGMFVRKGAPKSRYRPGSSTDILIFQKGRIEFTQHLIENSRSSRVHSRYTIGFGQPVCESEVRVRETIARRMGS
jgi:phosphatidylserine decarboxylase